MSEPLKEWDGCFIGTTDWRVWVTDTLNALVRERRVADALDRRYVHYNPQSRLGDPGQFCKRCETAHPTLEVCPEVDMRPAAEPTAAPEQPKVGADLVADLRYGAEGDGYPLSSEQCAALLRAIGEQP